MIGVYTMFLLAKDNGGDYSIFINDEIDLIGLSVLLIIDIIYYVVKIIGWVKYGNVNGVERVNP